MLARLRRRAGRRRATPPERRADDRRGATCSTSGSRPAASFTLAFIALNSLFLLATRDAQRQAFRTMADHLAPGGLAVVDVWLPDADDLARFDGRLILEYDRDGPRDRQPRHEGRRRPARRRDRDRQPDRDLRGGPPGRAVGPLRPARRAAARVGRRARGLRDRRPGSRSRRSPATTTWGRSGPAAIGRSSWRVARSAAPPARRTRRDGTAVGGRTGTSGRGGVPVQACYTRPQWHRVTRPACSSSRTSRRWRSTSAAC